jgi:hypothetical protein
MSSYDIYSRATTVAALYGPHPYYHSDFDNFVQEAPVDPETIDTSGISNSTASKEDFLKEVFSKKFHVVWGRFDINGYGPGNYLMASFKQTPGNDVPDVLRFSQFGRGEVHRELGPSMNVTSNSISFTGSSFECILRKTEHLYKGEQVWNLQGNQYDKLVYNYYLVPIEF